MRTFFRNRPRIASRGAALASLLAGGLLLSSCLSDSPPPWVEEPVSPPSAPLLDAPANGLTVSTNAILSWSPASNASSYRLQVSPVSDFASFVFDETVYGTVQQLTGLASGTLYYWRVSASNEGGASAYSATRTFTTLAVTTAPATPVLVSPAAGATGISLGPILSWNPSEGASSYRLEVSASSAFSGTPVYDQSAASASRQVTGLSANTLYHWRVTASNSIGSSAPTAARSFTTGQPTTAPAAPALLAPSNGLQNVATNPTFTWSPSSGATSYSLQISASTSFTGTLFYNQGASGTSQAVAGLSPNTTYYWRVGASNTYGTEYSGSRSFGTRAPIPGEVWKLWSGVNTNEIKSVAWGNNQFLATTTNGFLTSPDGINWSTRASGTIYDQNLSHVIWSGSQFVAIANPSGSKILLTSPDGINWTTRSAGTSNSLYALASSESGLLAVGYNVILTSSNGVSWASGLPPTTYDLNAVVKGGARYVAVGEYGVVISSTNGTAWSLDVAGTTFSNTLQSVAYNGSLYVAVGYAGRIVTSVNGTEWTPRPSGVTASLYSITASDSLFVAVGEADSQGSTILVSADGITWSKRPVPGTSYSHDLNAVVWTGTKFVAGAANGTFVTSP